MSATELTGTAQQSFEVVKGTAVTLTASVTDSAGAAVNITGATIVVRWKNDRTDADGAAIATASGTVTDGPGGVYTFAVPSAATATAGDYVYHVEVVVGVSTYYPQGGNWTVVDR